MKKSFFCIIIILSTISCCRDQIVSSHKISDEQKNLIPFEQDTILTYVSQQDISFSANAKQKRIEIIEERTGPDSCDLRAFDILKSSVFINIFEIQFEFILSKGFGDDDLILSMKRIFKDGAEQDFRIENCAVPNNFNQNMFTDIEINGFLFNDILVFKNCYMGSINQVIYSSENGIEYIDFSDGRYLKLNR